MGEAYALGRIVAAPGPYRDQHGHRRVGRGALRYDHGAVAERNAGWREPLNDRAHEDSGPPAGVGLNQPTVRLVARSREAATRATASRVTPAIASHDR